LSKGLVAVLLIVSLVLTWVQFKQKLLQIAANHLLTPYQLSIVLPQDFELGWQQAYFPVIDIHYQNKLQQLSEVTIRWPNFSVSSISIGQLSVVLPEVQPGQGRAQIPNDLLDRYQQWRQLPELEFNIERLTFQERVFSLNVVHNKTRDKLQLLYEDYSLRLASAYKHGLPYFEYEASQTDKKLLSGKMSIKPLQQDWQLAGRNQVHSARFFPLVKTYIPIEVKQVSGLLDFELDVRLSAINPEHIRLNMALSQDSLVNIEHIYSPQQAKLQIEKGTDLSWQKGQLTVNSPSITLKQKAPEILLSVKQLVCSAEPHCVFHLDSEVKLDSPWLGQFISSPLQFERLNLALEGQVSVSETQLEFQQSKPGRGLVSKLNYSDKTLQQLPLAFSGLVLTTNMQKQSWQLQAQQLSTEITELAVQDVQISTGLEVNNIRADSGGLVSASLIAAPFVLGYQEAKLPSLLVQSQFQLQANQASLSTEVEQGHTLLFSSELRHQLQTGLGWADVRLEPNGLNYLQRQIFEALPQWPQALSFVEGNLSALAEVQWQQDRSWSGLFNLHANNVSGFYGDTGFQQVQLTVPASFDAEGVRSVGRTELRAELLDIGLPLEQISVDADWNSAERSVQVHQGSANMLGGKISTQALNYQQGERSQLEVRLDGLQLDQMLELLGDQSIQGRASISGLLPLVVSDKGISMDAGKLGADGTGFIQYTASSQQKAQLDPTLKLVNDALSNYHFDTLLSRASYDQQGELLLNMKLTGANPDMNNGQAINLNLNLSNNIPQMLKSLQVGRDISQVIERQYKAKKQ